MTWLSREAGPEEPLWSLPTCPILSFWPCLDKLLAVSSEYRFMLVFTTDSEDVKINYPEALL